MPEPTATTYHHFIPTPTPMVSALATPTAPGTYPASVETVSFTASGVWVWVVVVAAIAAAWIRSRRRA